MLHGTGHSKPFRLKTLRIDELEQTTMQQEMDDQTKQVGCSINFAVLISSEHAAENLMECFNSLFRLKSLTNAQLSRLMVVVYRLVCEYRSIHERNSKTLPIDQVASASRKGSPRAPREMEQNMPISSTSNTPASRLHRVPPQTTL